MKNITQIKHDTPENWAKAINFIPKDGELIMYDGVIENNVYIIYPRFKIGNGVDKVKDLKFIEFQTKKSKCQNEILSL